MNNLSFLPEIQHQIQSQIWQVPRKLNQMVVKFISKLNMNDELQTYIQDHSYQTGTAFVDDFFHRFALRSTSSSADRENIPSEGRLICLVNNAHSVIAGLAILHTMLKIRHNVKLVTSDPLLLNIGSIKNLLIINSAHFPSTTRDHITTALDNEMAVIVCTRNIIPGQTSRKKPHIFETAEIFNLTCKHNAPILPVCVDDRPSLPFYFKSLITSKAGQSIMPSELKRKRRKNIFLTFGQPIPVSSVTHHRNKSDNIEKKLNRHIANLRKNKSGPFATEASAIHPIATRALKTELQNAELLHETDSGISAYLTSHEKTPNIVREIARLREITFRKVGEGTGGRLDFDNFDTYFDHLFLWSNQDLEIIGAYRLANGRKILSQKGLNGFYLNTLFKLNSQMAPYLDSGLELGRSFIQKKYWRTQALDLLWLGIGAYIQKLGNIKYLIGPVSISGTLPYEAKAAIVYFYKKWFPVRQNNLAKCYEPFPLIDGQIAEFSTILSAKNYKQAFRELKSYLKAIGAQVPPLYRHYTDLCELHGIQFVDFNIDATFQNCVDGMVMVEVDAIKAAKKERYLAEMIT